MNKRFLDEARSLESVWKNNPLMKGIERKWSRQQTAPLLESQPLWNETRYYLKVRHNRPKKHIHEPEGGYRAGFRTLEEMFEHIKELITDLAPSGAFVTFSGTGDCTPVGEDETVLTLYEVQSHVPRCEKILHPRSAGGQWDEFDEWYKKSTCHETQQVD